MLNKQSQSVKLKRLSLLGLSLVALLLFVLMLPAAPELEWGDSGTYINMAHALVQGKGLRLTYLPTEPVYPIVPAGYPLVLTPFAFFFPYTFLPWRLSSAVFMLVAMLLVYRYTSRTLGHWGSWMVAALFVTNVLIVKNAAQVMSEGLFLCCLMAALLQVESFVQQERPTWKAVGLTAFLIALPVTIRYLGAPISAMLALYVLARRRDRIAVAMTSLAVAITALINLGTGGLAVVEYYVNTLQRYAVRYGFTAAGEIAGYSASGTAGGSAPGLWDRMRVLLTDIIPGTLIPLFHGPQVQALFARLGLGFAPTIAQLGIVLLLLLGLVQLLRRTSRAAEWVVLGYGLVLFILPTDWEILASRYRYWTPLIPFGYHYLLLAVQSVVDWVAKSKPRLGPKTRNAPVVLFALAMLTLNLGRDVQETLFNPIINRVPDIYVGTDWLRMHSNSDEIVMVATPTLSTLYLQRQVVPFPFPGPAWESHVLYQGIESFEQDPESLEALCEALEKFEVAYILINTRREPDRGLHWHPYVRDTLVPLINSQPQKFTLLWSDDTGFNLIYAVQHDVNCITEP